METMRVELLSQYCTLRTGFNVDMSTKSPARRRRQGVQGNVAVHLRLQGLLSQELARLLGQIASSCHDFDGHISPQVKRSQLKSKLVNYTNIKHKCDLIHAVSLVNTVLW